MFSFVLIFAIRATVAMIAMPTTIAATAADVDYMLERMVAIVVIVGCLHRYMAFVVGIIATTAVVTTYPLVLQLYNQPI